MGNSTFDHVLSLCATKASIKPFKLDFTTTPGTRRFKEVVAPVDVCRVHVLKLNCLGPTIGVSKKGANATFSGHPSVGFALQKDCWGLCLANGKVYSEGTALAPYGTGSTWNLEGTTIRMEIRTEKGELSFFLEPGDGDVELGTISMPGVQSEVLDF